VLVSPVSPAQGSSFAPTVEVFQSPGSLKGSNLAEFGGALPFSSVAPPNLARLLVSSEFSSSSCGSGPSVSAAAPPLSGASKLGVKIHSSPPLLQIQPFQHYIRRAREFRVGHSVQWNDELLSDSLEASKLSANLVVNKVLMPEPPAVKVVKPPVKQGILKKGFLNPHLIVLAPFASPPEVIDVGVVGPSSPPSGCIIPFSGREMDSPNPRIGLSVLIITARLWFWRRKMIFGMVCPWIGRWMGILRWIGTLGRRLWQFEMP
jgi:hypothetical protein